MTDEGKPENDAVAGMAAIGAALGQNFIPGAGSILGAAVGKVAGKAFMDAFKDNNKGATSSNK